MEGYGNFHFGVWKRWFNFAYEKGREFFLACCRGWTPPAVHEVENSTSQSCQSFAQSLFPCKGPTRSLYCITLQIKWRSLYLKVSPPECTSYFYHYFCSIQASLLAENGPADCLLTACLLVLISFLCFHTLSDHWPNLFSIFTDPFLNYLEEMENHKQQMPIFMLKMGFVSG